MNLYQYHNKPKNLLKMPFIENDGGLILHKRIVLPNNQIIGSGSWKEAYKYCYNLKYNGCDDWRLPHKDELEYLFHINMILDPFNEYKIPQGIYWCADMLRSSAPNKLIWGTIDFNNGLYNKIDITNKNQYNYIPIRSK